MSSRLSRSISRSIPRTYAIEDEFNILVAVGGHLERYGVPRSGRPRPRRRSSLERPPHLQVLAVSRGAADAGRRDRLAAGFRRHCAASPSPARSCFAACCGGRGCRAHGSRSTSSAPASGSTRGRVMAAVPASVMVLLGASLLLRDRSRPAAGGLRAGARRAAASLDDPGCRRRCRSAGGSDDPRARLRSLLGPRRRRGAGCRDACSLYNCLHHRPSAGERLLGDGNANGFKAENIATFLPLYRISLLVMPLAGWAAFSPRWSRGLAIPLAVGTVVVMASLYYFRDGLGYGVAGLLPAQRFLLPRRCSRVCRRRAILATVRRDRRPTRSDGFRRASHSTRCFGGGSGVLRHRFVAVRLARRLSRCARAGTDRGQGVDPRGSHVLVGERAYKSFAPVLGTWQLLTLRGRVPHGPLDATGRMSCGSARPEAIRHRAGWPIRRPRRVPARSWVWNRDVWIGPPARRRAHRDGRP